MYHIPARMIRKELASLGKTTSLSWRDQLCRGPGPVLLLTRPALHHPLPVKASQRTGKSPERRLSACVDTNPGLRGEASLGMNWVRGGEVLGSSIADIAFHEPLYRAGSSLVVDFIRSISLVSFCCLIVMSSKSLLPTKCIIQLRH
jgi:hypothetical protein